MQREVKANRAKESVSLLNSYEIHNNAKNVPKIIRDHGFDFHWSEKKVWALHLKTQRMRRATLEWILAYPFWRLPDNTPYSLKPIEVIRNPQKYAKEYQRILRADTFYPIDIMRNKYGKWLMLDGLHRLCKLYLEGRKIIEVRKLTRSDIPKIIP